MPSLKNLFLLDPEVVFLNHGSFGATPRPVFEAYQAWQRRVEAQPVSFLATELFDHLRHARQALADFVGARADDLAFVPNATFGINVVAHSLNLDSGDEILTTDHEYGACDNAWEFISRKTGASYVHQPIPLPATSSDEIVEQVWSGVTPRTKVIFISHITSATALHLPVETICRRAREAGILTVVDGAHAPGQIAVDLAAIQADFYAGNCHKWLSAPKGSAFLYTDHDRQELIEPLIVSWGWGEDATFTTGSRYLDNLQWWGTMDPSAFLSVPAAIQFQKEHNWPAVRRRCHTLVGQAVRRICDLTGLAPLYPHDRGFYHQMAIAPLPTIHDLPAFKERLYEEYCVEVPCVQWNEQQFIRVSVQGYNTQADIDRLIVALEHLIPQFT
ncbi:MAG: aminotransferase class V-fold PLP-dependent enzyme [Anaerolineae bacterium]